MEHPDTEQNKGRLAEQYDKFVAKSHDLFVAGRDFSQETLNVAIEKTREQMTALGELSAEQAASFSDYMKRDLEQTTADMNRLGDTAKEHLNPRRASADALSTLASLLQQSADSLRQLSAKANPPRTSTDETTGAGTLTCLSCGHKEQVAQLDQPGTVPICPNCRGRAFEKSA